MNFNFSIQNRKDFNSKVLSDLNLIKNIILKSNQKINNIILVGGFGRGEGSILDIDNKIYPINDYDLVIISKSKISSKDINFIKIEAKKYLEIRQIDIIQIQFINLKKLKYTIFNYDLKYSSLTLYGNDDFKKIIPEMEKKIPFYESRLPLFVYLSSIFLSYPDEGNFNISTKEKKFWIFQQITKSILGWSMAKLCSINQYHSSYVIRNERYQKFFNSNKDECNLVKIATEFKLNPKYSIDIDLKKIWHLNKNIHLETLLFFININKIIKFKKVENIIKTYKFEFRNLLKLFYGKITHNEYYKKDLFLNCSKIYLLKAISINNNETEYIKKSLKELKKINLSFAKGARYFEIAKMILKNDPNSKQFLESSEKFIKNETN